MSSSGAIENVTSRGHCSHGDALGGEWRNIHVGGCETGSRSRAPQRGELSQDCLEAPGRQTRRAVSVPIGHRDALRKASAERRDMVAFLREERRVLKAQLQGRGMI